MLKSTDLNSTLNSNMFVSQNMTLCSVATNYIFLQFSSLKCVVALVEVAMIEAFHEDFPTIGLIG